MTISPPLPFPVIHARKTLEGGAVAFSDEAMTLETKRWHSWQSQCPDQRQRYVTIEQQTFQILWRK